jgi:hypothetical protein
VNAIGTIVVNAPQSITLNYGGPFCVGFNSVTPTNSWTGGGTYSALPAGLNLNSGTGTVSFATSIAGTYTITFTPTGCASPVNAQLILNDPPVASVIASSTICSGTSTNLPISSTPSGATFTWTQVSSAVIGASNGSSSSISQTLTATGISSGNVVYTIVPSLNGCQGSAVVSTVTVNPANSAGVPSANPTLCPNSALTPITINTTGATGIGAATGLPSGVSAIWLNNVITISGTPTDPGIYNYSIPLTGGCGNVSATGTITINDVLDFVNLQFPPSATICATGSFNAFGQLYNTGAINTVLAGAAPGVTVQIGYSIANSNPAAWTSWVNASFNAQVGNNDEYIGTLSGLAAGTYYYAFRYQVNGCAWQYGGYSSSGGGFWNGSTNVNGVLTVDLPPNAGVDGAVSVCASGNPSVLFNALSGGPAFNGVWSGPSSLDNGAQGIYDPLTDNPGTFTYTVQSTLNACPADNAFVTVTETSSPQASIAYASPICASLTAIQTPLIIGALGGTFSASPSGLGLSAAGAFNPSTAATGMYTITYSIAPANGCSAFQTQAMVVIQPAPAIPTLSPTNPCAIRDSVFTAGGGAWYEFFVNGVSTGPASAIATLDTTALTGGTQICVRSYPAPPIMDGDLSDPSWTPVIPGTIGGPASQAPFTVADTRLDGLKMLNRNGRLYIAVAGNEIDGTLTIENNRILLFIDSKPGGYNALSSWLNRSNAGPFTDGIRNLDGGIQFDAGFEADYILSINRANLIGSTTFYDLYDMAANTNSFLGSSPSAQFGYQESFIDNDLTRGFEFYVPLSSLGNPLSLKVFGMLVNDPGPSAATLVSNQFFSVGNTGENNYGNGAISFPNAAPNMIAYQLTSDCFEQQCVTVTPSVVPTFVTPSPICQGDVAPALPASSTNVPPVIGTWTGPVSNQTSGTYTFTPAAGQCAGGTQLGVIVNATPSTDGIYHD